MFSAVPGLITQNVGKLNALFISTIVFLYFCKKTKTIQVELWEYRVVPYHRSFDVVLQEVRYFLQLVLFVMHLPHEMFCFLRRFLVACKIQLNILLYSF